MVKQFAQLDRFLIAHQEYWRCSPFHDSQAIRERWQHTHPALVSWLDGLSLDQVDRFKCNPSELIEQASDFFPEMAALLTSLQLPESEAASLTLPRGHEAGIPGRKLDQILSMGNAALAQHRGSEWLEWCSGKGYLGRFLAGQSGQAVTSFEYQASLCESGQSAANQLGLPMTFVQGDAFAPQAVDSLNTNQHAVALHACGDLHVSLIQMAVRQGLPAVTIAPCCYHLIRCDHYQPLSQQAQQSTLLLSKDDLRIPLQETVTGGARVKRHRQLEMVYRLGFDSLLKHALHYEYYLPIPSIKKSMLAEGFENFCDWAANEKGLTLPSVDFTHYEKLGIERFDVMERLSLIQDLFKRPLELWLTLDKAIFLSEHNYQVHLSTFCDRQVSPRNILIHASLVD
ncbi:SAM-dependent methyltransferase [Vibrio profundum]|uniref:methyltransferase n=1 Tax=Vibrio profundum TaxID=2910247 RepID=UPI003D1469B0